MLIVKLVRHGQSMANTGELNPQKVGEHRIPLSRLGQEQAHAVGKQLGATFLTGALLYSSPYQRARDTLEHLLAGAGMPASGAAEGFRAYEDPRLREVDHGYADVEEQELLRSTHGSFYYRFQGGESPADCYDRTSGFLESMMREVERKDVQRVLIVTHGLTIRCFVMRFLHLTVEQFERLANPDNCDVITLGSKADLECPLLTYGSWGVCGLRLRKS
jgi:broad specificity phosphatase PhoE